MIWGKISLIEGSIILPYEPRCLRDVSRCTELSWVPRCQQPPCGCLIRAPQSWLMVVPGGICPRCSSRAQTLLERLPTSRAIAARQGNAGSPPSSPREIGCVRRHRDRKEPGRTRNGYKVGALAPESKRSARGRRRACLRAAPGRMRPARAAGLPLGWGIWSSSAPGSTAATSFVFEYKMYAEEKAQLVDLGERR